MGKAADRLRATMGILVESQTPAEKLYSGQPKTAPGKLVLAHQEARAYKAEIDALKNHKIKIADLHEIPGRKRNLSKEKFEELKANLAQNSLAHAIVVRARKEGGFEIVAGHNRVQAYIELGRDEIEADVRDFSDSEVDEAAFYSNLFNSALTDYEKYLGFKDIQSRTQEGQEALANRAGISVGQINNLLSFSKLPKSSLLKLEENPHLLSAELASKLKNFDEQFINEAIDRIAVNPKLTHSQILSKPSSVRTPQPEAILIKRGKKTFVKMETRANKLVLTFSGVAVDSEALEKITKLLNELSN